MRVENLSFSYGRRRVLRDISWTITEGITGLIGPNGAGKSTLLNCLTGLSKPSQGSIVLAPETEDQPSNHAAHSQIGFVPQEPSAPARMTSRKIVEYCAWLNGVQHDRCRDHANDALARLTLERLRDRRFGSLSGGEKRRVMIAAGIVHNPRILVLDEPTVGLDPSQRLAVRRAIASLVKTSSVLIATHLVEDIEHLCANVAVLHHGRIGFSGPTMDLLARVPADSNTEQPTFGSPFERAYELLIEPSSPSDINSGRPR